MSDLENITKRFEGQLDLIIQKHQSGNGGIRTSLALTRRIDQLIASLVERLNAKERKSLCVVALGGYGRKELCFYSDIDIMVLTTDEESKVMVQGAIEGFLHALFNADLDIGHSVRTIPECLEVAETDFDIFTALLESRFIAGNRSILLRLLALYKPLKRGAKSADLVMQLLASTEVRRAKYGNSTKLLEPNVKNSAGGLRDLHSIHWLLRGTGIQPLSSTLAPNQTGMLQMLSSPLIKKQFHPRFIRSVVHSFDFLQRCRNEMHLQSRSLHDMLEFNLQRQVADALHHHATPTRTSVERFMQEYYISTRVIYHFSEQMLDWVKDHFLAKVPHQPVRQLDRNFILRGNHLDVHARRFTVTNELALRAFFYSITVHASLTPRLEDTLSHNVKLFKPLKSSVETGLFRTLLRQERGVSHALHTMNAMGILSRWIPEWRDLVAFFQHNQYHYYTADEHTLRVLANLEGLAAAQNIFGEVFRKIPQRDTLYLAALLHDIAKPQRIGDHEIIGVDMARKILERMRSTDVQKDVLFLVRHHLTMEQVAFRRNLHDPQTIMDFAETFETSNQLDMLYVLTYADLCAVNRNVWSEWKGSLLQELYQWTREVLDKSLSSTDYHREERLRYQDHVERVVEQLTATLSESDARDHIESFDSAEYLKTFETEEIAEHIHRIGTQEKVSVLFDHQAGHTAVTVIAHDEPFALSRFCGVLSANDANILDAHIFTRNDGIIIDQFRVADFITGTHINETQCDRIRNDLKSIFAEQSDIEHLLARHRMKWKRRAKPLNPNIRIDVEFEDHPRYTIIDVYAPDMLGFLYRITSCMSSLGLNISFAKIATRTDGIVDAFYVTDESGKKIESNERMEYIHSEIMRTINELTTSELVIG
ncbi:MAG: [protein-PII] uridylyltransferase [bacterium]